MEAVAWRNPRLVSQSALAFGSGGHASPELEPAPTVPPRNADAVSGDRALAAVYREHHRFVWRSLARLGVCDDRLADGVHDVFMVVARRLPEFEGRSTLTTWLFAIAVRVAQGMRRDDAREHRRREKLAEVKGGQLERPHQRADAAKTLRDLLDHLDDGKRAVFVMSELEGMTAPEIGEVLGLKTATVYSRLRLARAILQRVVDGAQAGPRRDP